MEKIILTTENIEKNRDEILKAYAQPSKKYAKLPTPTKRQRKLLGMGKDQGIATAKYIRVTPRKMKIVIDLIKNKPLDEAYAIQICIQKNVTDGNGMGFGLFSTSRLVDHVGISMQIHSGGHMLVYDGKESIVKEARHWQGTVVFLDLHSDQDFNPDEIAKDCVEEYDEMFLDDEEATLW